MPDSAPFGLIFMIRWILKKLFPPISARERRLRSWANTYNFGLIELSPGSYALVCGVVRYPFKGGCDLEEIENFLHGCKYNLLGSWK